MLYRSWLVLLTTLTFVSKIKHMHFYFILLMCAKHMQDMPAYLDKGGLAITYQFLDYTISAQASQDY